MQGIDLELIIRLLVSVLIPAIPVIIAWRSLPQGLLQRKAETNKIEAEQRRDDAEAISIMIKSSTDLIATYKDISKHFEDRYKILEEKLLKIEASIISKEAEIRRLHKILISLIAGIKILIEQVKRLDHEPDWEVPDHIHNEIEFGRKGD